MEIFRTKKRILVVICKSISAYTTCAVGYRVEGNLVNGVSVLILVGRGIFVTHIRKYGWEWVNALQPWSLSAWTGPSLVRVDGTLLQVCSRANISLERDFEVEVLLVNSLGTEAVLGFNFLQQKSVVIDFGGKQLLFKWNRGSISLQSSSNSEPKAHTSARVVEAHRMPLQSERMVMTKQSNMTWCMVNCTIITHHKNMNYNCGNVWKPAFSFVRDERFGHQLIKQKEFYDWKIHGKPCDEGDSCCVQGSRKLHLP